MKLEDFRKQLEEINMRREQRSKRPFTDEEWHRMCQRGRAFWRIFTPMMLIFGLALAHEWPGPWIPGTSLGRYLGWIIVVLGVFNSISDLLKGAGMFYRLEDEDRLLKRDGVFYHPEDEDP